MKKKVLSGLFALALLATVGFGVNKSMKSNTGLSELALANVEALAQVEDPGFVVCVHPCPGCWCVMPPTDVDPVEIWVEDAEEYK
jgi:hypothetical protein